MRPSAWPRWSVPAARLVAGLAAGLVANLTASLTLGLTASPALLGTVVAPAASLQERSEEPPANVVEVEHVEQAEQVEPEKVERVEVFAARFNFTPAKIRVARGTRLEIVLASRDVEHGFEILGTETEVRIPERGRGSVTVHFDAVEPGRYAFRCAHKCGAGHEGMRGVIVVE